MTQLYRYILGALLITAPSIIKAVPANTVIATIPVGVTPDQVTLTPDNRFLYVANNNNYGIAGSDSVTVINTANNLVETTIFDASFNQPYRITMNAAGTKAYVTNSNACTVSVIDIATNTVSNVINGFDGPSGFAITPDGNFAYVNNYGAPCGVGSGFATTVRVVDLNTELIVGPPIVVDLAPAGLAITPDGAYVYVINYTDGNPGTGTISIIRTSDNTVVAPTITGFSGPFAIAITPDGKFAYVTNFGSNNFAPYGTTVSKVDLNTNTIIATIDLAIQPAGVAVTPDSRYVYATNFNSLYSCLATSSSACDTLVTGLGTVNIIDVATDTVLPPNIAVNQGPSSVAITTKGEYAYVNNYTSNTVSVIALQSFQLEAEGCQTCNRFLTQQDIVNQLTVSATGLSLPVTYSFYRDAGLTDLIATVPATNPTVFLDHNRNPKVTDTYYIVGTNAVGTTSDPVALTVTQNC
jgi:YVTN family beta-propeller protein